MIPGGLTEAISYFAGYLRLYDDIARGRERLDGGYSETPDQDYTARTPDDDRPPVLDEMQAIGTPAPEIVVDDAQAMRIRFPHLPHVALPDFDDPADYPLGGRLPPLLVGSAPGGGGGGFDLTITVTYQSGGEQSETEIHQVNYLVDNDSDLFSSHNAWIADQLAAHADPLLGVMIQQVEAEVPPPLNFPQDTMAMISAVAAHDQDWRDGHDAPGPAPVQPGYYLDGEAQSSAPDALNPTLTSPFDVEPPDTGHGLGQWADVGSNTAVNAAQIVDVGGASGTMVVLGDYFSTSAIFQVNAYANSDTVHASAGASAVHVDPSESTNAAGFVSNDGVFAGLPTYFAGPQWDVDVVNGDYYNVSTLVQTNYISDNDVVMQTSADTHYNVVAGDNQLVNYADVLNGDIHYDLIIVGGSYHSLNAIYQYNILINNDLITSVAQPGNSVDASQSIDTGGNQLTNAATIETYGNQQFDPIDSDIQKVIDAIAKGETSLDPSLGTLVNGYGGPLHILYITGDYYDLNAIWQTSVMVDSNYVTQMLEAPSAGVLPLHPDGTDTQSVTSGHDQLLNLASIVVAGDDQTYLGGQTYGDMILIQANLLPQEDQAAQQQPGPQSLATELVAFLNDTTAHDTTPPQPVTTVTVTVNDDPMSSMMH